MTVKKHKTSSALSFQEAGTFLYHDSNSAAHGQGVVPMKVDAPPSGPVWRFVQGRVNGGAWAQVATTSTNTTGYKPTSVGTWEFQTYLHHALSGANSRTSLIVTVNVR